MTATWVKRDVPTMCATIDCDGEGTWTYGWFPYCDACHGRATRCAVIEERDLPPMGPMEVHRGEIRFDGGKRPASLDETCEFFKKAVAENIKDRRCRMVMIGYHLDGSAPGADRVAAIFTGGGAPWLLGDLLGAAATAINTAVNDLRTDRQQPEEGFEEAMVGLSTPPMAAFTAVTQWERMRFGRRP